MADEDQLAAHLRQLVGDHSAVVALSGGADSAVVALMAVRSKVPVRAVHVHHGQEASDELSKAATAIAAKVGIACDVVHTTVSPVGSFETAAREARYEALLGALRADEVLLVGHTSDDQAETVLMRLARGAGLTGIAAMRPAAGKVIRPLLSVSRSKIRGLADSAGLPYLDDPANLDRRHTRVVVRQDILPRLEEIQPGAIAAMARHAELARLADDHLRHQGEWAVQGRRLPVAAYLSMDPVLQAQALRTLAARAGRLAPGTAALSRMHDVAIGRFPSAQVDEGFEIVRVGTHLEVVRSCRVPPTSATLPSGLCDWGAWQFSVSSRDGRPSAWPLHAGRAAVPDRGELSVRALRPNDWRGSRRLEDELVGIPAHLRRCWPVVELDGEPIWVPRVRRLEAGSIAAEDDSYRWIIADRRDQWTSERS